MTQETDIVGYHKDEDVVIALLAKNRDGSVLNSPATQDVYFNIGETPQGAAILDFSTDSGNITLRDAPTAEYSISLEATDIADLAENQVYYYTAWTVSSAGDTILQNKGAFKLLNSIKIPS